MNLYIFAGPNGSGKSTLITEFKKEKPTIPFIDVDKLHKKLLSEGIFANLPDIKEQYLFAMECAEEVRNEFISRRQSFGFKTVFSTDEKVEFLRRAKYIGYKVIGVFITTKSPEINKDRVAQRVKEGGHDVPPEKIESRYYKSCNNLQYLIELSDELYVYDNSKDIPDKVYIHNDDCYWINTNIDYEWMTKYLLPYIDAGHKILSGIVL